MAEFFKSELREALRRRSGADLEKILRALDADGAITIVDDPPPDHLPPEEENGEPVEVPYAPGSELFIKVDADEKAAAEGTESDEYAATAAAVELAEAEGVNLAEVEGTGENGRITKGDVEATLSS